MTNKALQVYKAVANGYIDIKDRDDIVKAYESISVILTDEEVQKLKLR